VSARLIHAYALVKKACALANERTGWLDADVADAIASAADEIASGLHDSLFTLDALQGGAGTSTNMALNEVIANRANDFSQWRTEAA
jgi:aspartate ammonia-lyase